MASMQSYLSGPEGLQVPDQLRFMRPVADGKEMADFSQDDAAKLTEGSNQLRGAHFGRVDTSVGMVTIQSNDEHFLERKDEPGVQRRVTVIGGSAWKYEMPALRWEHITGGDLLRAQKSFLLTGVLPAALKAVVLPVWEWDAGVPQYPMWVPYPVPVCVQAEQALQNGDGAIQFTVQGGRRVELTLHFMAQFTFDTYGWRAVRRNVNPTSYVVNTVYLPPTDEAAELATVTSVALDSVGDSKCDKCSERLRVVARGQPVRLPCGHVAHAMCVQELRTPRACPLCSQQFLASHTLGGTMTVTWIPRGSTSATPHFATHSTFLVEVEPNGVDATGVSCVFKDTAESRECIMDLARAYRTRNLVVRSGPAKVSWSPVVAPLRSRPEQFTIPEPDDYVPTLRAKLASMLASR